MYYQKNQGLKPIITSEAKGISQIKAKLGQSRADLRWKIKLLMPPPINKPIVKLKEKPIPHIQNIEEPKATLKISIPESSRIHDRIYIYTRLHNSSYNIQR